MKQIEIKGKKYDLHFGIDFIREMDKRYEFKGNGVSFGMGLQAAVVYLKDFNSVAIADIIQAATTTQRPLLKNADIEAWIEEQGDNFEKVFDDFLSSLKKSPVTRLKVNKVLKEMNLQRLSYRHLNRFTRTCLQRYSDCLALRTTMWQEE